MPLGITTGGMLMPVNGSPTSRLLWQPDTCPICPHRGVGLFPVGSSIHSPTSCAKMEASVIPPLKARLVSYSDGEYVCTGLPNAPWNPRTQQLLGEPIYIT